MREKLPKMEDVVFKGGGDALQALLSGTVQLCSGSLPPAAPHIKAGTLRCLAVTGESAMARYAQRADDAGSRLQGFRVRHRHGVARARQDPAETVKWLEKETLKVLATQEMKDKLYKAGFQVRPKGADAAWARVTKEIDMFKDIIDQAGIKKL